MREWAWNILATAAPLSLVVILFIATIAFAVMLVLFTRSLIRGLWDARAERRALRALKGMVDAWGISRDDERSQDAYYDAQRVLEKSRG